MNADHPSRNGALFPRAARRTAGPGPLVPPGPFILFAPFILSALLAPFLLFALLILPVLFAPGACSAAALEDYAERIAREFPAPTANVPGSPEPRHWGGGWGMTRPGVTVRLAVPAPDATVPGATVPEATVEDAGKPLRLALTLDACGGAFDREIIVVLREYSVPATLFVTSLWLRNNREAAKELAADPLFSLQAHGARHLPASVSGRSAYGIQGTGSVRELVLEVEGNARDIAALTGVRPLWYRSSTAHYDDAAIRVIHRLGLRIAGFSRNGDDGGTLSADAVYARLMAAKDGDIILCHMNRPRGGTARGLRRAIPGLLEKGALFLHLAQTQ